MVTLRLHAKILSAWVFGMILLSADGLMAKNFQAEVLPHGKEVTIPRPATTLVNLGSRVQLTATDVPQNLSFKSINAPRGVTLRLAIFDPESERVKYIKLNEGTPYIYAFQELGSITVIPDLGQGASANTGRLKLQIESDKPLSIAR